MQLRAAPFSHCAPMSGIKFPTLICEMKAALQLIRKMQFGLGLVLAILFIVGVLSYRTVVASRESDHKVRRTHAAEPDVQPGVFAREPSGGVPLQPLSRLAADRFGDLVAPRVPVHYPYTSIHRSPPRSRI